MVVAFIKPRGMYPRNGVRAISNMMAPKSASRTIDRVFESLLFDIKLPPTVIPPGGYNVFNSEIIPLLRIKINKKIEICVKLLEN